MNRRIALLGIFAISCFPEYGASQTQDFTAKTMLGWCTSENGSKSDIMCNIYMIGYVQALHIVDSQQKIQGLCLPDHFTPFEARAIFIRELRTVPALQDMAPDVAVWASLHHEFPCPNSN